MRTTIFQLFALLFICSSTINGQEIREFEHKINSTVYDQERTVLVYVPERYLENPEQEFAVTYILDSQLDQFWNMAKDNIDYLVYQSQILPMITVGIVSESRGFDFNPNNEELSQHFEQEVFPLIAKNYRVNDFRIVVGHSWGGAYIGNTVFGKYSYLFNAYIGISPSFDAIDGVIFRQADSLLSKQIAIKKYLYASSGDFGYREDESYQGLLQMDSIIKKYPNNTLGWKYEVIKDTGHWTCVIPSLNNGLVAVSRNYMADKKVMENMAANTAATLTSQLEDFTTNTQLNFGFTQQVSFGYLRHVADDFREQGNLKAATELYQYAIAQGNEDVVCYFNLADAYAKQGYKAKAKAGFQKALVKLEEQKQDRSERFYTNLKAAILEAIEENN